MSDVRRPRRAGQKTGPTLPQPAPLDWGDSNAVARWLADLRIQVDDAIAAGIDATAPPGMRDLGRRSARRTIVEARSALDALLSVAGA